MYSLDPLSAFHVRCCSVPMCYLFHCSIKFCNIKLYANNYKIMQLELETSCVLHFKYAQLQRDVAPYEQHFCSDFLLFRVLGDGPAPTARCSQRQLNILILYCLRSKLPFLQIPALTVACFAYYNRIQPCLTLSNYFLTNIT